MKTKLKIIADVLLVIAAIAISVYNFSMQRTITYMSSVVAVCGTVALLIRDIATTRTR